MKIIIESKAKTTNQGPELFMDVIYGFSKLASVFVPSKPLPPSLMFVGKAGGLP